MPIYPDPHPPFISNPQQIFQYEFYNYSLGQALPADPGETGNWAINPNTPSYSYSPPNTALAYQYFQYFNDKTIAVPTPCQGVFAPSISVAPVNVQYELYNGGFIILARGSTGGQTLPTEIVTAIAAAYQEYVCYVEGHVTLGRIPSSAEECTSLESPPSCPGGS